ncbi:phosphatidylinositol N-acetylglucosaminyltransferase subunit P [Nitzschia inconspicua]|uniref:Phosphatidylinositol N-acetylglucosaminyltransferase subunit P n=1 Tax=Nitzschia inconspicua TaxID=303405 RepID=A0A9K3KWR3_9STRA|nr:phosphatidylinositol N-acetylglucosaminyltransferase subunit P [Nitzschia inconspicua]
MGSSLEKCSFVCHVLVFPIGLLLLIWVLVPDSILEEHVGLDYVPRKEYSVHVPVSALFLFLAAPLIYAGLNTTAVPKVDSMDTLQDNHTRRPKKPDGPNEGVAAFETNMTRTLPEICDLDPATLVWYPKR